MSRASGSSSSLPRVCVIGAGSSGITAVKALDDRGLPFDCFEKSDRIGGNWVLGNRNGMSSSYSTLHINTSRERMEYADLPMPSSYPDFPRHDQIACYFDEYVDHFGLREKITFQCGVESASRADDGSWRIALDTGEERLYDALIVANGHHWDPRLPEPAIPGEFAGQSMHSHHYTHPSQLAGRHVVVVGMGNSAMDIAVDASYHAASTRLVARKGVHVVPKYILGRPLDAGVRPTRMPFTWMLRGLEPVLKATVGPMARYGLPEPDHRLGQTHPTVSSRILDRLAHGAIEVRPEIAELRGEMVRYRDGREEQADLIVYCTGYKISFPFFEQGLISAADNELALYKRIFPVDQPGLCFIGFVQPWGAIMPIAETQSKLVGDHLLGAYALPSSQRMRKDIDAMLARQRRRYLPSKRHTIQVDFSNYMVELADEARAGAKRALERRFALPQPGHGSCGSVAAEPTAVLERTALPERSADPGGSASSASSDAVATA